MATSRTGTLRTAGSLARNGHSNPVSGEHAISDPRTGPFLKWAGGKARLWPQLEALLPAGADHMRHVEPFLGGGAVFFARRRAHALLSDTNEELIGTYLAVRDHVGDLLSALRKLEVTHRQKSDVYYDVRKQYNEGGRPLARRSASELVQRAAQFVYLNKTCFNGLHRVNSKGHFNVPQGRYANPSIADAPTLMNAQRALRGVTLFADGFDHLLENARPGDFVYLDPPYEPMSATANFTSYAKDGFTRADQARLAEVCHELHRRGCHFMMSNNDVPLIRELYKNYEIHTVLAPRAISRNGAGRQAVHEVAVTNYSVGAGAQVAPVRWAKPTLARVRAL